MDPLLASTLGLIFSIGVVAVLRRHPHWRQTSASRGLYWGAWLGVAYALLLTIQGLVERADAQP